ncbi:DUF1418 family protein [Affinibrenneria salicis]|nr:DUF1418 family protein [Affinibrenneria salicis]
MRSLGDLPKGVLILEAVGILLLGAVYLHVQQMITLPGVFASHAGLVGTVLAGVALMVPAAACLVWRTVQGFPALFGGGPSATTPRPSEKDSSTPADAERESAAKETKDRDSDH